MGAIAAGLSMILAKIAAVVAWIGALTVAVFVAFWDLLRDVPAWMLEELMKIVSSSLGAIDVSAMQSLGSWWSAVPADVLNIMGLIGFGYAMGIVVTAIGIRLVLQLIPFTRLGS